MQQPEQPDHNQINCYDIIKQSGHDQDQYTGDERNQWLNNDDINIHLEGSCRSTRAKDTIDGERYPEHDASKAESCFEKSLGVPIIKGTDAYRSYPEPSVRAKGRHAFLGNGDSVAF